MCSFTSRSHGKSSSVVANNSSRVAIRTSSRTHRDRECGILDLTRVQDSLREQIEMQVQILRRRMSHEFPVTHVERVLTRDPSCLRAAMTSVAVSTARGVTSKREVDCKKTRSRRFASSLHSLFGSRALGLVSVPTKSFHHGQVYWVCSDSISGVSFGRQCQIVVTVIEEQSCLWRLSKESTSIVSWIWN